ncbi:hypothetical protein F900_01099 [Acinetobacter modestus]|uniref:Uncharacterized protein n=1 Tax=Acinetobacter modestus TaxID=1776740 RepID=N9M295_9GAMM|nr:hypothetical protein [Acinetobacter modestus]ENX02653.1 hypothetical protein F900_01099 [Acinetobacter modestus]
MNCLATSINTSFPDFFTSVPDAVYYLSFEVTENNVATTKTASFNSDTQRIYTYAAIFSELIRAAGYEYLGNPVDGWATIYSVFRLSVDENTLSGVDQNNENWANQSRPIDFLFIETPSEQLISVNGLTAIDLYPMLKSLDGAVPTLIHSCGYANSGSTNVED